jgi:hypothetical protein
MRTATHPKRIGLAILNIQEYRGVADPYVMVFLYTNDMK